MLRVGLGYDIHRLHPGHVFVLGGVTIPFPAGFVTGFPTRTAGPFGLWREPLKGDNI